MQSTAVPRSQSAEYGDNAHGPNFAQLPLLSKKGLEIETNIKPFLTFVYQYLANIYSDFDPLSITVLQCQTFVYKLNH
jgi:hypothetical protein